MGSQSAIVHSSIANEQGVIEMANSSFRILSNNTGHKDSGTYRMLTPDRIETSAVYGISIWDRVPSEYVVPQPTPRQPDPRPTPAQQDVRGPIPIPPRAQHEALTEEAATALKRRQSSRARGLLQQALQIQPDYARAHALMGYITIYYQNDLNKADRHYRKAYDLRSTITFRLLHDLGDGISIRHRTGTLEVSKNRVLFRGDNTVRVFITSLSGIREAR